MSFITDAQLLQAVSDRLHQSGPGALPAWWSNVVTEANAGAYQTILGALLERGFSLAQVSAWDRGAEFQKAQGLWLAFSNGGCLDAIDLKELAMLNREKELCSVQVFAAGVWQRPQDPQGQGTVGSGPQDEPSDVFTLDTRW